MYRFEGESGHEIIVVFEAAFALDDYQHRETITFQESDGTSGTARWYDLARLNCPGYLNLYPKGLKALLTK
jgi:hypothetical protein